MHSLPRSGREEVQGPSLRLTFWTAATAVFWIDQGLKFLAIRLLSVGQPQVAIDHWMYWTLVFNTGGAFGLLDQWPHLFGWISAVSVGVFIWLGMRAPIHARWEQLAYGLILGGVCGNLTDRLSRGAVVDYLDFRVWPVFNLADSAITVGVCIILLSNFCWKKR